MQQQDGFVRFMSYALGVILITILGAGAAAAVVLFLALVQHIS